MSSYAIRHHTPYIPGNYAHNDLKEPDPALCYYGVINCYTRNRACISVGSSVTKDSCH